MLKYLRIAVTVLSLTAWALLIALWVRSYYSWDQLRGPVSKNTGVALSSNYGRIAAWTLWFAPETGAPGTEFRWNHMVFAPEKGRGSEWRLSRQSIRMPHWFPVLAFAALAIVPWLRRFSLRNLLIATTLVAVALGTIAASM